MAIAADAMKSRLLDSLHDAGISAKVTFQQPSGADADCMRGLVEVKDIEAVSAAESVLRESLSITARKWLSKNPGETPRLEFKAIIPPDVKPTNWLQLPTPPTVFIVAIQGTLDESEAEPPATLHFPESLPSVTLVMKGGGIKGLAYVGALEVLEQHYSFDRYVGTSAGAITALLKAAGYTTAELKSILDKKDFREFFDSPFWKKPFNLLMHGGLNHANAFTDWMDELLATKLESAGRVKMSDLPIRATVFASRKEVSALRFDSASGDHDAAHAARCSMSIPLIFVPQSDQGFRAFDGGLRLNYPVDALLEEDSNARFLGLYLGPETYQPSRNRWQVFDWLSIWTESNDPDFIKKYRDRTVIIDPEPIGTLDFDLSDTEKHFLLMAGRAAALAHLEKNSEQHCAAVEEREALRVEVRSIRKKRKWIKRCKRLIAALAVAAFCWYAPVGYESWRSASTSGASHEGIVSNSAINERESDSDASAKLAEEAGDFRKLIGNALNRKRFNATESTRKDNINAAGITNVSGRQSWLDGSTGEVTIAVQQRPEGLTAEVVLPYSAKYEAKNFIGILSEYRYDSKHCTGTARFSVTKNGRRIEVGEVEFWNASPGASHDSGRMAQQAVKSSVIVPFANDER